MYILCNAAYKRNYSNYTSFHELVFPVSYIYWISITFLKFCEAHSRYFESISWKSYLFQKKSKSLIIFKDYRSTHVLNPQVDVSRVDFITVYIILSKSTIYCSRGSHHPLQGLSVGRNRLSLMFNAAIVMFARMDLCSSTLSWRSWFEIKSLP